eukprot:scaffold47998_cov33-Phaeocystis_antarctica.AAC.2
MRRGTRAIRWDALRATGAQSIAAPFVACGILRMEQWFALVSFECKKAFFVTLGPWASTIYRATLALRLAPLPRGLGLSRGELGRNCV